ncbi:unnamed protein product [Alopecurus aequalis]
MDFPGGNNGRPPPQPLPPMTPLPLTRQGSSVYSLTFDEFQSALGGPGKDFGSMNMDELLRNIWTAEESQAIGAGGSSSAAAPPDLQRQGSLTLPRTLSQKTVDEVWRDMVYFGGGGPSSASASAAAQPAPEPAQRQQTLGEVTLEEFLVRAGVVREDMAPGPPPISSAPTPATRPPQPPQPQMLFPQSNMFAPMVNPLSLAMAAGPFGQGGGGGGANNVVSPARPVMSNGYGNMEGLNLSSLSPPPMPYVFNGGLRGRKAPAMEKVVERRQRRMIKNRESAARSRQRKQSYMMELETEVAKLKERNEELQRKQAEILERQKNEVLEKVTRQVGPTSKRICLRRTLTGP